MAADNLTSIEQQADQARADYAEAAAIYRNDLAALMASSRALIHGYQTIYGALLAFLQSRAKEALAAAQRVAECGSPQDAAEIQLEFAREALQAYADHLAKCSALSGEALDACVQPYRRRAPALADRASDLAA